VEELVALDAVYLYKYFHNFSYFCQKIPRSLAQAMATLRDSSVLHLKIMIVAGF